MSASPNQIQDFSKNEVEATPTLLSGYRQLKHKRHFKVNYGDVFFETKHYKRDLERQAFQLSPLTKELLVLLLVTLFSAIAITYYLF